MVVMSHFFITFIVMMFNYAGGLANFSFHWEGNTAKWSSSQGGVNHHSHPLTVLLILNDITRKREELFSSNALYSTLISEGLFRRQFWASAVVFIEYRISNGKRWRKAHSVEPIPCALRAKRTLGFWKTIYWSLIKCIWMFFASAARKWNKRESFFFI